MRTLPYIVLLLVTWSTAAQDHPFFRHITTADGLNGSSVISLDVDQKGYVWIGTANGLTRHDGARLTAFHHVPGDSTTIPDARIDIIRVISDGSMYVGTQDGVARFDERTQSFWRLPIDDEERVVVHDIDELPSGKLLLSTWQHGTFMFDPETDTASKSEFQFGDRPDDTTVRNIVIEDAEHVWLARYFGLYRINLESGHVAMPDWPAATREWTDAAAIFKMLLHERTLWMATTKGLWSIQVDSGELTKHALPDVEDPYARSIFVDSKGTIWAGMHGKLAYFDQMSSQFHALEPVPGLDSSVFPGTVHSMTEDHSGVLWVGSDERGVSLHDLYRVPPAHHESRLESEFDLPEGHVWSAAESADGSIWLGSERAFGRWIRSESRYQPFNVSGLENTTVSTLLVDERDRIWVGTTGRGVCRLRPQRQSCEPVAPDVSTVYVIHQDDPDELWIGSFGGLLHLNTVTGAEQWYRHDPSDPGTLDSGLVLDIHRDQEGRLWIGTESGLNRHDPVSDSFVRVLPNNPVFSIEPRPDGLFWLAGLDISVFDPDSAVRSTLDPYPEELIDGMSKTSMVDEKGRLWVSLASSTHVLGLDGQEEGRFENPHGRRSFEFPVSAKLRTRDGTIVFGLADAVLELKPEELVANPFPPVPVVAEVRVDDVPASFGSNELLEISSGHRILSVAFSAPHFSNVDATRYEVKLGGFDDEWRAVDSPQITFTTLPPADYAFDVRATASNGLSATLASPLRITVLTPWWTTWWFITLMLGSGSVLIMLIVRWRTEDLRRQNTRLDQEVDRRTQELSEKAVELEIANQTKSRFFSNVSHELRTPLTLIKGYLEDVESSPDELDAMNRQRVVRANGLAQRMEGLVSQLLDLSRADNNRLELNAIAADLTSFVARVVAHFQVAANRKFIDLGFECTSDQMAVAFDPIKMDQIVSNLISNAVKFTPNNGSIWVVLEETDGQAILRVADTGPGISAPEQERIFERFYQIDNELTRKHEGLGVGLSLTYDLVRLHGGTITVDSTPGEGSVFSVALPLVADNVGLETFSVDSGDGSASSVFDAVPSMSAAERPLLLVVEDNNELRRHIREILSDLFDIVEANDGAEGWRHIQLRNPDVVLSDVMMPGMSGLELLQEVRQSDRFKDLPFVLLTARSHDEAQAEGLEARADDFIGKPFNRRVLRARLSNLARRQQEWNESVESGPTGLQDDHAEFLRRSRSFINQHLSEPISVADLAEATHTSERTFQRRMKEITGQTAGAFVRKERLEAARSLLERGDVRSVSHAAHETGFGNVSHFSKVFEEQFGINPRTYLI